MTAPHEVPPGSVTAGERVTPEIRARYLELLREKGPAWRLQRAFELTESARAAAERAYLRSHPGATRRDCVAYFATRWYGEDVAALILRRFDQRAAGP